MYEEGLSETSQMVLIKRRLIDLTRNYDVEFAEVYKSRDKIIVPRSNTTLDTVYVNFMHNFRLTV
jgi:Trk K+ transport system NAD-binding subunit